MINKKILNIIGALSSVVIPSYLVVSCGANASRDLSVITKDSTHEQLKLEKSISDEKAKNTKISVAVRASDVPLYKTFAEKFNSFQKGEVEINVMPELQMLDLLQQQEASNSLPNVFLVDMNTIGEIVEKSVFVKPILLSDIIDKSNSELYDVHKNQTSYNIDDFAKSHVDFVSNKNGVQYAVPVGYGSQALMMNDTMVDHTKHIYSYVPIDASSPGLNIEQKTTGTKKLLDSNGKPVDYGPATFENIKKYINEAGNSKNKPVPEQNWLGWGVGNMFQRIYSVARSSLKEPGSAAAMSWKELYGNFPIWASAIKGGILKNHKLDAKDFINKYYKNEKINDDVAKYLWNSFGGYTYLTSNTAGYVSSDGINETIDKGEVEPFMEKAQMFMLNAKWALNMSNNGWSKGVKVKDSYKHAQHDSNLTYEDGKGISSGQIKVLSLPYTAVGLADSLAISHTSSAAETLVSKRFLKFLFDISKDEGIKNTITFKPDPDSTSISGTPGEVFAYKFTSSNNQIASLQKNTDKGQEGWYEGGQVRHIDASGKVLIKSSDTYRKVDGTGWQLTSGNFFNMFGVQIRPKLQSYLGIGKTQKPKWTYEQFKELVNDAMKNFVDQYNLS